MNSNDITTIETPQTSTKIVTEKQATEWAETLINAFDAEFQGYVQKIQEAKTQAKRDFYKRKIKKMGKRLSHMIGWLGHIPLIIVL